jgi:hypothetical protein
LTLVLKPSESALRQELARTQEQLVAKEAKIAALEKKINVGVDENIK